MRWLFFGVVLLNIGYFFTYGVGQNLVINSNVLGEAVTRYKLKKELLQLKDTPLWLGGFFDKRQAEALLQRLVAKNITASLVEHEKIQELTYSLYLEGEPVKSSGLAVHAPLAGLDRYRLLQVFESYEAALGMQKKLATSVENKTFIKENIEKSHTYWVSMGESAALDAGQILALFKDFPEMKLGRVIE
ncbi:hypothetical protein HX099_12220 [Thiopseudomonas alkaliphila]|uniref:Sporulation related protein n=1 Tax=Thiopseudomonas alkaliphila TaxID=1697053 RepID=A0AAW7DUC0_9GAMM|nr:hypothetical protein [Thiopseudomonas alkaliphila]MDM1697394.1 hypothetical protein [Thiopseudomonas alkaliphila]